MTGSGARIDDSQISKEIAEFISDYPELKPVMTICDYRRSMSGR